METILYLIDGRSVSLVIRKASVKQGLQRELLIDQLVRETEAKDFEKMGLLDLSLFNLQRTLYPSLIAAVSEAQGFDTWPIPFEEFIELDEDFVVLWEKVVFELNPSWMITFPTTPDEIRELEKKVTQLTADSLNALKINE